MNSNSRANSFYFFSSSFWYKKFTYSSLYIWIPSFFYF